MSHSVELGFASGTHSASIDDHGQMLVEWYAFGEDAPYESLNSLVFSKPGRDLLAAALGRPSPDNDAALLDALAKRFNSYFDVRQFADSTGIPYKHGVDFCP